MTTITKPASGSQAAFARFSRVNWLKTGGIFLLFFLMESIAFAMLPLSSHPGWMDPLLVFHTGFMIAFLIASVLLKRSHKWNEIWQVFYVFFVGSAAILISTLFSGDIIKLFGYSPTNPQGIALVKLVECVLRVSTILILMALIGSELRSLYLAQGRLALGLTVGLCGFIVLAAIAFVPLVIQPGMTRKFISLAPWILIFVFANGFAEELLFRGLYLQRYEPFLGKRLSNLLAAIVFTLVHMQVNYVSDVLQFLVVVFPLALIWGYLMQKTGSLWGSAIFHAGADCVIIFGIFASV